MIEMKLKESRSGLPKKLIAIASVSILSTILLAPRVSANGYAGMLCGQDNVYAGSSADGYGASTDKGQSQCGDVAARTKYYAYPGSPVYYTSFTWNSTFAYSNPGNVTTAGGIHRTRDHGWLYPEEYTT